ncbi:MAG: cbb3-type cytochrome c oxidase subunit II, partial [Leptospiraceae bacterium]|nr:cbb3-type cytochrome c oxidase subunit II [Leptospiraceae bacterium]
MIQQPIRLFFTIVLILVIGYAITVYFSFEVDLHGKHSFTQIPENPLVLKGSEIYYQEGCQYCHTLNVRTQTSEIKRYIDFEKYGYDPSIEPNEFLFFAPFPIGMQRIGPDLSTVASRYTKEQLEEILIGRSESPTLKKYHNYAYLFVDEDLDPLFLSWKVRWLMNSGLPINDPYQRGI